MPNLDLQLMRQTDHEPHTGTSSRCVHNVMVQSLFSVFGRVMHERRIWISREWGPELCKGGH